MTPSRLPPRGLAHLSVALLFAGTLGVLLLPALTARAPVRSACDGDSGAHAQATPDQRLPPGHPPVHGRRALPPGHPPISGALPPGHPPIPDADGTGPELPPGHPPVTDVPSSPAERLAPTFSPPETLTI